MANGKLYPRNSQEYLILIGQSLHSVAMIDQKYSKIYINSNMYRFIVYSILFINLQCKSSTGNPGKVL